MMSNTVFLRGRIIDVKKGEIQIKGNLELLEICFHIETRINEITETHPVLAYGRMAIRMMALLEVKLIPVEGVIEGQLSTKNEASITIARNITLFQSRRENRLLRHHMQQLMDETIEKKKG